MSPPPRPFSSFSRRLPRFRSPAAAIADIIFDAYADIALFSFSCLFFSFIAALFMSIFHTQSSLYLKDAVSTLILPSLRRVTLRRTTAFLLSFLPSFYGLARHFYRH